MMGKMTFNKRGGLGAFGMRGMLGMMTALGAALGAQGEVTLPNYVTDNMIVQQNSTIKIKGHAAAGSKVTVTPGWGEARPVSVKADKEGRFAVELSTPAAGGPYSMVFADSDGEKRVENVLSGEVWLCSGQSNMEMPVQGWTTVMDYDREIATAFHPDIRLQQVRKRTAFAPQEDVEVNMGGWQTCNSASMADYSAIAFFFARELHEKLGVPVGVIDATWGGTPAEAWTSYEALHGVPGFEGELADLKASGFDGARLRELYGKRLDAWMAPATAGRVEFDKGKAQKEWKTMKAPGYWELSELPGLDGIVWMQRTFDLPADMAGEPLTLNFRAIDDEDVTYVNGVQVGAGSGYDTPRSYTVPASALKAGENVITVRVSDFGGEGGIAPGAAEAKAGGITIDLSGDWSYLVDTDFSQLPPKPADPSGSSYPSVLYNAMIYPLADMPVKGVLWYQGCANVGRDAQYAPLFKSLIGDWRKLWGKDDLPFYFVQLAGWLQPRAVQPDSQWAALRAAQAQALALDNTGMAVAIDLGNPADIHPKNKQDVAHRLALIALGRDYGGTETYAAPRLSSAKAEGDEMVLTFDGPVHATSTAITGFIIAGKEGKFTTATPRQAGENILRLSAPGVKAPAAVRYDWADFPCGNLYGPTGLPVAPFATDK